MSSESVETTQRMDRMAADLHADYVDVSGAGHMVAGDDNHTFTEAVLRFLSQLGCIPADNACAVWQESCAIPDPPGRVFS